MTAIPSLSSAVNASSTRQSSSSDAFQSFTSQDFLKVMFAELTKQDPLQPNDSKALLDQIGQIRAIESDLQLTDKLEEMSRQNQVTVGGSLLGKFAEGKTPSGAEVRGYVDSVSVTKEGLSLNLSTGFSIPMDRLSRVIDPALIQPAPGNNPTPPDGGDDDGDGNEPTNNVNPLPTFPVTEPKPNTNTPPPNNGGPGIRP